MAMKKGRFVCEYLITDRIACFSVKDSFSENSVALVVKFRKQWRNAVSIYLLVS